MLFFLIGSQWGIQDFDNKSGGGEPTRLKVGGRPKKVEDHWPRQQVIPRFSLKDRPNKKNRKQIVAILHGYMIYLPFWSCSKVSLLSTMDKVMTVSRDLYSIRRKAVAV